MGQWVGDLNSDEIVNLYEPFTQQTILDKKASPIYYI